jgi:hypothetical protein
MKQQEQTFIINTRVQKTTTMTPCTISTHVEPADWTHKWFLLPWFFDFPIFTVIVLLSLFINNALGYHIMCTLSISYHTNYHWFAMTNFPVVKASFRNQHPGLQDKVLQ